MMMIYDGLMVGFEQAIYGNAIKVLGGNIQIHAEGYHDKPDQTPLLPLPDDQEVLEAALASPRWWQPRGASTPAGWPATARAPSPSPSSASSRRQEQPNGHCPECHRGRYLTAETADVLLIGKGLAEAMDVKVGDRITLVGAQRTTRCASAP